MVFGSSLCLLWSFLVQENTAPEVKLILTRGNEALEQNSLVSYRIEVSDKEDGISDYGEIPMNEVILSVKYVSDSSKVKDLSGIPCKQKLSGLVLDGQQRLFYVPSRKGQIDRAFIFRNRQAIFRATEQCFKTVGKNNQGQSRYMGRPNHARTNASSTRSSSRRGPVDIAQCPSRRL